MSYLAGLLEHDDSTLLTALNPNSTAERLNQGLAAYTSQRNDALDLFVEQETTLRSELIQLDGIDLGQEMGIDGRALEGDTEGEYSVAYFWRRIRWATSWNLEKFAYLTVADLDRNYTAKIAGNRRRHVLDILKSAFDNRNFWARDPDGRLYVRRLANGDETEYSNAYGERGTENLYLTTGFPASGISATNNPFKATIAKFNKWHGEGTNVALINTADVADYLRGLDNLVTQPVPGITPGLGERSASPLGVGTPGTFVGIDGDTGTYLFRWDLIPAGYQVMVRVGLPQPLVRRVPLAASLRGFKIESENEFAPFYTRQYVERYGYSVKNRLSMSITQLTANANYTVPAKLYRPLAAAELGADDPAA